MEKFLPLEDTMVPVGYAQLKFMIQKETNGTLFKASMRFVLLGCNMLIFVVFISLKFAKIIFRFALMLEQLL